VKQITQSTPNNPGRETSVSWNIFVPVLSIPFWSSKKNTWNECALKSYKIYIQILVSTSQETNCVYITMNTVLKNCVEKYFFFAKNLRKLHWFNLSAKRWNYIYIYIYIYRVIHKSLRDFRPLRYSSRDGHAEGDHVNRGRDTSSFCPTLQVLDMCTLGDVADVNPVIKFLRHAFHYFVFWFRSCSTANILGVSARGYVSPVLCQLSGNYFGNVMS
jgi:hypothetical protein